MIGKHFAIVYEKLTTRGGLERYVLDFARRCMLAGARITFVTSQVEARLDLGTSALKRLPRSRISLFRLMNFDRDSAAAQLDLDVDAVLGFGQTTRQDIHRAGGGCHAEYSKLLPAWRRLGVKNRIQLALERDLYCGYGTKHYVVNSNLVRRQVLETYQTDPERVTVVHTAVDTAHFKPSLSDEHRRLIRTRLGIPMDEPLFMFVSLNHKRKGLEPLLRAWYDVPAWLMVLGEPYDITHYRLLASRGLGKRVVHAGNANDLAYYYNAADYFVHPTVYDACANTVLQAMASGVISIVSVKDGATDHISDGTTGFLLYNPLDAVEIRDTCLRALEMPADVASDMRTAARERIMPLTWQSHLDAWTALINKVAVRQP